MNINDVKQLKTYYETELKNRIAKLLGLNSETITTDWTLERTIISVSASQQNTITNFSFEYNGTDFIIRTTSYQAVAQNNIIVGIIAGSATISLNTIHAIFDTVVEVLNTSINKNDSDCAEGEQNA